jgi:hypothetical protein
VRGQGRVRIKVLAKSKGLKPLAKRWIVVKAG